MAVPAEQKGKTVSKIQNGTGDRSLVPYPFVAEILQLQYGKRAVMAGSTGMLFTYSRVMSYPSELRN